LLASGACHECVINILTASEDRRKLVAASALRPRGAAIGPSGSAAFGGKMRTAEKARNA
jgi:hypothetical protein